MAYYNSSQNSTAQGMNEQEDDQAKKATQPVQLSQGTSASPGTSTAQTMGTQQPSQAPRAGGNAAPASSGMSKGSFQAYTGANQGAAQNRLNQAAAKNVTQQGQQAKTGINQANTAFNQRMDAGSLANRQQAVQDVSDITGAARQATAAPAQAQTQQTTEGETATTPAPANQYGQLGQDQVSRFPSLS